MKEHPFIQILGNYDIKKIKDIVREHNTVCSKEERKEARIKKYAKLSCTELTNLLNEKMSQKEKDDFSKNHYSKIMSSTVKDAKFLLNKGNNKEKILSKNNPEENVYEIITKNTKWGYDGYEFYVMNNWEDRTEIKTLENGIELKCSCEIGAISRVCKHKMAIFLWQLGEGNVKGDDFPLNIKKNLLKHYIEKAEAKERRKNAIKKPYEKYQDESDDSSIFSSEKVMLIKKNEQVPISNNKLKPVIRFTDSYEIYIDKGFIKMKWGGKYPGEKIRPIPKNKDEADLYISSKVVQKIIAPFNIKMKIGIPRVISTDNYGVIKEILKNQKLTDRILRHFSMDSNLPQNKKTLKTYMQENLINME